MNFNLGISNKSKFVILLILLVVVFNLTGFDDVLQNQFFSILAPIQTSLWSQGISIHQSNLEETDPKDTVVDAKLLELEKVKKENAELREALELDLADEFEVTRTRIVGSGSQDFVIINKGSNSGIQKGFPVITSSRGLAGKVTKVLNNFSYIQLVSHPDSSFEAKVRGKENSLGAINGGEELTLEMIDRKADLEKEDRVITYPESGIYPSNLFVGTIKRIEKDDVEALQTAFLRPAFSFRELKSLFVITEF